VKDSGTLKTTKITLYKRNWSKQLYHPLAILEMDSHTHYPYIYYFDLCILLISGEGGKPENPEKTPRGERAALETNSVHK